MIEKKLPCGCTYTLDDHGYTVGTHFCAVHFREMYPPGFFDEEVE